MEDHEDPNYVMGHKVTWPKELKTRETKVNATARTAGAPGRGQGGRTERKSRKDRAANKQNTRRAAAQLGPLGEAERLQKQAPAPQSLVRRITIDTDLQNGPSAVSDAGARDCADTPVHSFQAGIKEEGDPRSGPWTSEPVDPERLIPAASTGAHRKLGQLVDV